MAFLLICLIAGCSDPAPAVPATTAGEDLKFSRCMRDQGLTWFPDPETDGGLKVSIPAGTDERTLEQAQEACREFAPGANQDGSNLTEEDLTKLRQMSQCIRDHGFAKYPDPDAKGGIAVDSATTGISPDDPAFEKARTECQKYLPPRRNK